MRAKLLDILLKREWGVRSKTTGEIVVIKIGKTIIKTLKAINNHKLLILLLSLSLGKDSPSNSSRLLSQITTLFTQKNTPY